MPASIEPTDLIVTPYALTPPGWPTGRKLTVTVIADLHAGGPHIALPQIARIVDTANALRFRPHRAARRLQGPLPASARTDPERALGRRMARLDAPLGVWAILGNHDWWFDARRRTQGARRSAHPAS